MSSRSPSFKFGEIVSTGTISMICGIGAIMTLFQNLTLACVIGIVGVSIGILTLRMRVERLDKILAFTGIVLSLAPMVYSIIILAGK
jgi:hypothetical protein